MCNVHGAPCAPRTSHLALRTSHLARLYSLLSADVGSTCVARRAGTNAANSVTARTIGTTTEYVRVLTWYVSGIHVRISRAVTALSARPTPSPAHAGRMPWLSTIPNIRADVAPMAMRIP